ncbi:MAG: FTR1 family protein [Chloroflexota bacterium]|nr:FTR1 family protein [Chloroflexota bacterium]
MLDAGALTSGLLTGLREGVEAALIVAIVLAYLAKTGNARHFPKIWVGAGAAVLVSVAAGIAVYRTVGGLREPYEQIFEGVTMLLAAGVVTWMLFWMRRQAASVKGELQRSVDRVLTGGSLWGLAALAFTAVIREGIETSLFLVSQVQAASAAEAGAPSVLAGALVGLAVAVAIGYGFYRGSRAINLQSFFRWTGIALVFIAAGLLSHAVHEFVEVGLITVATQTAFDISRVLPHDPESGNVLGQLLRALFGYSSTPEVVTLLVHVVYLAIVLPLYLRPVSPRLDARAETVAREA